MYSQSRRKPLEVDASDSLHWLFNTTFVLRAGLTEILNQSQKAPLL